MSVHLHVRSAYTLLQSTLTISKIIQNAKQYGYRSVALTDKNVMYGCIEFYHACKKANIHPILGLEVDVLEQDALFGFILLAKDDQGYLDLIQISTLLNTNQHASTLTMDELTPYTSHLIVISNGAQNSLETYLVRDDVPSMTSFLQLCKQQFHEFYVGIARNDSGLLQTKNPILKQLAKEMGILSVAISRIYYAKEEEDSYKALCALKQQTTIYDKNLNVSLKRHFRSQEEMHALYDQEDLIQTDLIAKKCNVTMTIPKAQLPHFENEFHVSSEQFLRSLCIKGLEKRLATKQIPLSYRKRLEHELKIIIDMKFEDYFLIVWDFIRYSRKQGIYVGPGRGSAAGSLVAYCIGITHIDPLQYDLLFERFLNPERVTMPDIDTDFPDDRRDEVIQYMQEKYGVDHCTHVITFNTLGAKQVIRDVGRVLNIPIREIDSLSKMIPSVDKVSLQYAYENSARFKQKINSSNTLKTLYDISKTLEGLPRHTSVHPAGLVLAQEEIKKNCPLIDVDDHVRTTQVPKDYLEELGLIKIDFLAIRNLTIINEIVSNINRNRAHPLDIMHIPLNDAKTFELIRKGNTSGIFQIESDGMTKLLQKLQPCEFEDIVIALALYRPGPMQNINYFLDIRKHPEKITYIHPILEPILKSTFGTMIYQEQIMMVAQQMAGFSLAKADSLRYAISKKNMDDMARLKSEFIHGAMNKGFTLEVANQVYLLIMEFANYGFNKSHSVAYSYVVYQMAYLKANAPLYFYTSILNSVIGAESKTSKYIYEVKQRGIQILPPSVNESSNEYLIKEHSLRLPLTMIKGIGNAHAMRLIQERNKHGNFKDFYDFVARMSSIKVGKGMIETLIHAGALDEFGFNRATLLHNLAEAILYGDLVMVEDEHEVSFNFDIVSKPIIKTVSEKQYERAQKEKELYGFYLSHHPIEGVRNTLQMNLQPLIQLHNCRGYYRFVCMIEFVKQHRAKNGALMAFLTVSDETYKMSVTCMPDLYELRHNELQRGAYFYVEGIMQEDDKCLAKKMKVLQIPS